MAELTFVQLPTGRTHQVRGIYEQILDDNGDPETEWALCAVVNGHRVVLQTFSNGYVDHMVGRPDTEINPSSDEGESSQPATTTSSTGTPPSGVATAPAPQVTDESSQPQADEPASPQE
jgi:hypothetical protein